MKIKNYLIYLMIVIIAPVHGSVIMTGIMDGTLEGGTPKAIELFITGTEDLSEYYLERSTNGGIFGNSTPLSGTYTNTFVYLIGTASGGVSQFQAVFGNSGIFANQLPCSLVNGNGDDAFRIVKISSGEVIDQIWYENYSMVYMDSYLYRIHGSGPDSGWVQGNWLMPGNDILDGLLPQAMANAVPFGSYCVVWEGSLSMNWNEGGNWSSSQEPSENTNVLIRPASFMPQVTNDPDDPATCRKLTVDSQTTLTVNAGKALTVNGKFVINAAPGSDPTYFLLKSETGTDKTGSLLVKGPVTGSIRIQRDMPKDWHWHFLASPVTNQAMQPEFVPAIIDTTFDFYSWDPDTTTESGWVNIRDDQGNLNPEFESTFLQGKGYLAAYGPNNTGDLIREFYGAISFGDRDIPVSAVSGGNSWNLLGNPYACSIDWSSEGIDKSKITGGAMYIWNQDMNQGEGGYLTHNGTVGIPGGTTPYIHPTQGFFIHASGSGNISFDADSSDVLTHSFQGFYKYEPNNLLRLQIEHDGFTDETVIYVNPNSTNGFDTQFDSYKLFAGNPGIPEICSVTETSQLLTINAIRDIPSVVPLLIRSGVSASVILHVHGVESFPTEIGISLKDNLTGQVINLRENGSYGLDIEEGENSNRLYLHLESVTSTADIDNQENAIWFANGYLHLHNDHGTSTLRIYSITGQLLYEKLLASEIHGAIPLSLSPGCYILAISNHQGLKTSKLIIQ